MRLRQSSPRRTSGEARAHSIIIVASVPTRRLGWLLAAGYAAIGVGGRFLLPKRTSAVNKFTQLAIVTPAALKIRVCVHVLVPYTRLFFGFRPVYVPFPCTFWHVSTAVVSPK